LRTDTAKCEVKFTKLYLVSRTDDDDVCYIIAMQNNRQLGTCV